MTTQGGCSRLSLQTTYRLPLWVMALSILCLQRSQLRSYSQYSQAGLEQCLDLVLIHRFRQMQWMFLTDPEHWHRLRSGLRSPPSLPKHTLHNYSPYSPHDSRDTLLILKGDFSSLLRRRTGDWCTRKYEFPRLILSAMSMSDRVFRFSCMSISLKRWQIFLITNYRSARRMILPSCRAWLCPGASARQRELEPAEYLLRTIQGMPVSWRKSISNSLSLNLQRCAYSMTLEWVRLRKDGQARGVLAVEGLLALWKSYRRDEGASTEMEI